MVMTESAVKALRKRVMNRVKALKKEHPQKYGGRDGNSAALKLAWSQERVGTGKVTVKVSSKKETKVKIPKNKVKKTTTSVKNKEFDIGL